MEANYEEKVISKNTYVGAKKILIGDDFINISLVHRQGVYLDDLEKYYSISVKIEPSAIYDINVLSITDKAGKLQTDVLVDFIPGTSCKVKDVIPPFSKKRMLVIHCSR